MCGEKGKLIPFYVDEVGSPPHVRGKAEKNGTFCPGVRITPACAGKSVVSESVFLLVEDHPRVCGEKLHLPRTFCWKKGSPPRMRGKDIKLTFDAGQLRITPAYAGKRNHSRYVVVIVGDHPRVCGEKLTVRVLEKSVKGSPPRMRGKVSLLQRSLMPRGITPAYAGKRQ